MDLVKSKEALQCFSLNAVFGTCVGYAAFKVSGGILTMAAKITGADMPVNDIATIAAPVGMLIAMNSVARMAGELRAPKHKALSAIAGGAAAFVIVGYVSIHNPELLVPAAPSTAINLGQQENISDAYDHQMFQPT